MKKKKILVAVIVLSLFMAFIGCGESSADSGKKEIVSPEESTTTESSEAVVEKADVAIVDVTITEQVLVEQDGLKITATEYVSDSIWGDGIKLLVENNSEKDFTVGCDALIVNDYMITDLFVSEVAAGKKANEIVYLSSTGLKAAGIDNVGKVEIYFHAYDANWDYVLKNVRAEIQTSAYANMDTTANDAGMELYNKNGIRIVGKTVDEESFWGTAVLLYCENTSGKNVSISVDDMSINGFMMSPFFSTTIYDGKKSIQEITIFESDLEANGITGIEEVELKFHIYDSETFQTIDDSDPIVFAPQ